MEELAHEVELTSLFNKLSDGSKNVNIENALQIVYKLGYVPSKEDIDEFMHATNGWEKSTQVVITSKYILQMIDKKGIYRICSLSNIKKFCEKVKLSSVSTDGLVDVFNHYDVNKTGKISKDQFKSLFTTVGSRMSNAEMDTIIRELCNEADQIDYKEFLNK